MKHLGHKAAEASADRVARRRRSAEWVGAVRMPVTHPGHRFAEAAGDKAVRRRRSAEWGGAARDSVTRKGKLVDTAGKDSERRVASRHQTEALPWVSPMVRLG